MSSSTKANSTAQESKVVQVIHADNILYFGVSILTALVVLPLLLAMYCCYRQSTRPCHSIKPDNGEVLMPSSQKSEAPAELYVIRLPSVSEIDGRLRRQMNLFVTRPQQSLLAARNLSKSVGRESESTNGRIGRAVSFTKISRDPVHAVNTFPSTRNKLIGPRPIPPPRRSYTYTTDLSTWNKNMTTAHTCCSDPLRFQSSSERDLREHSTSRSLDNRSGSLTGPVISSKSPAGCCKYQNPYCALLQTLLILETQRMRGRDNWITTKRKSESEIADADGVFKDDQDDRKGTSDNYY